MKERIVLLLVIPVVLAFISFQSDSLQESMKRGKLVYEGNCISCHMQNGEGLEGVFPPLAKTDRLIDKKRLVNIIYKGLEGPITVNGKEYNNQMNPVALSEQELTDVLNYIRNSWGNKHELIEVSEIKELANSNSEDVVSSNQIAELMKDTITITVGNQGYKATLETNATAAAFKVMLPLTIEMRDLNSNEKFFDFSSNLPANVSNPGTINSGDIMLWGSNTLVLFYKTFSTTYSYTRVGKIENPNGLAEVLGPRNAKVLFELKNR